MRRVTSPYAIRLVRQVAKWPIPRSNNSKVADRFERKNAMKKIQVKTIEYIRKAVFVIAHNLKSDIVVMGHTPVFY